MARVPEGENCFAHHTLPVGKKLDSLSSLFERTENGTLYTDTGYSRYISICYRYVCIDTFIHTGTLSRYQYIFCVPITDDIWQFPLSLCFFYIFLFNF